MPRSWNMETRRKVLVMEDRAKRTTRGIEDLIARLPRRDAEWIPVYEELLKVSQQFERLVIKTNDKFFGEPDKDE